MSTSSKSADVFRFDLWLTGKVGTRTSVPEVSISIVLSDSLRRRQRSFSSSRRIIFRCLGDCRGIGERRPAIIVAARKCSAHRRGRRGRVTWPIQSRRRRRSQANRDCLAPPSDRSGFFLFTSRLFCLSDVADIETAEGSPAGSESLQPITSVCCRNVRVHVWRLRESAKTWMNEFVHLLPF